MQGHDGFVDTAMTGEIDILYVDDVAADVVLANHELRRGGLAFRSKRVDTRAAFEHELEHNPPDLIISDHGLPSFDGFTALAIAKTKCPDVPFIFVTGSLGEEMTIATFESGATDYVLKNKMSRLVPAVQRALSTAGERAARRQREQALCASEERFRLLVDGVPDYAISMLDARGHVLSWNSGAQRLHGYLADEVNGQDFSLFYTREDAERGRPRAGLKVAAAEGRFEEEGWRVAKGGGRFWANVVITALRDAYGAMRGFAQVTSNITERRRAEEALRRSEARKGVILETALDAILLVDHQGMIQEWNAAAERIFGYRRSEAVQQQLDGLIIPPALLERYRDGLANYLMTGVGSLLGRPIELTLRRADGRELQAELAITRVPGEEPPRFTVFIRDVTERKRAETALRQSEERLRLLVEGVRDCAIYMLDAEGRVATWNAGAERLQGYSAEEVVGTHFSAFFLPDDVRQGVAEKALETALEQGQAVTEGWRLRKDGSRFWTYGIITALRDESGGLLGFSKVAHDLTKQREAEEEVRRLNAELEQRVVERTAQLEAANKELEAFSYSVSHDLRAPLRHIAGYVEMLRAEAGGTLEWKAQRHLQTISESARHLGNLIDSLLAFSRMGRTEIRRQRVRLATIVEEARHELLRETAGRRIEWRLGALPEVQGDPVMLRQAVINLLSNALKYTRTRDRARIEIGAIASDRETVFHVRDNGVGFDMKYADKLFGVFERLHAPTDFEGTGIGLANVRRIVERHGGRTWAEGAVEGGATFYVALPHSPAGSAT